MEIAKYGRTVIIDDEMNDIVDLIKTLSQEGIATTYFTGDIDQLPVKPLEGISIMFLDIELNRALNSDRDKASQDVSVIKRILGDHANDGTVILIIWTSAISAYDELKQMMRQSNMRFLAEIEVEKSACKTNSSFDFSKIKQVMTNELEKFNSLQLMNAWDNTIISAAHRVYEKILVGAPNDNKQLEKYVNALYLKMAEAIQGKKEDMEIVPSIVQVLNGILSNEICLLGMNNFSYTIFKENVGALNLEQIGDLNRALNLVPVREKGMPGTIYDLSNKISLNYFELFMNWKDIKKDQGFSKKIEIMCEVTPLCDYVQKRQKVYRMLPGVIIPAKFEKDLKEKAEYLYKTPVFSEKNVFTEPFIIIFDLRYLLTMDLSFELDKHILLQLGESILMHIQNRLGRQVSNPGLTSIR